MDRRCSGKFFGVQWGIFFVLSEKMGQNLEHFRKIPKMSGEKKYFFCQTRAVTYFIATLIELQHFFFARIFLFWGKWGKIFFGTRQRSGEPSKYVSRAVGFCKRSERSEPRKYICRTNGFVNAASEASLANMFVVLLVFVNAESEASLATTSVMLYVLLTQRYVCRAVKLSEVLALPQKASVASLTKRQSRDA
jgi:hypothetical protein